MQRKRTSISLWCAFSFFLFFIITFLELILFLTKSLQDMTFYFPPTNFFVLSRRHESNSDLEALQHLFLIFNTWWIHGGKLQNTENGGKGETKQLKWRIKLNEKTSLWDVMNPCAQTFQFGNRILWFCACKNKQTLVNIGKMLLLWKFTHINMTDKCFEQYFYHEILNHTLRKP